ncbi:MAG: hypothetical protein ACR2RV_22610 [Verrucomicrobiales bacterium]
MSSSFPDQGYYIAKYDPQRGGWVPHAGSTPQCQPGYRAVPFKAEGSSTASEGVCKIFCCELDTSGTSGS